MTHLVSACSDAPDTYHLGDVRARLSAQCFHSFDLTGITPAAPLLLRWKFPFGNICRRGGDAPWAFCGHYPDHSRRQPKVLVVQAPIVRGERAS